MNISIQFTLLTFVFTCFSACSSAQKEEASTTELQSGRNISLNENNIFAWKKEDVSRGENNEITGGKRSQFDKRAQAAFGKGAKSPDFYKRDYHSKAWTGKKDYSKGSFKTNRWNGGGSSRFSGKNSRESQRSANASGKRFRTSNFNTGSAREKSYSAVNHSSSSYDNRRSSFRPTIFSLSEYRQMSLGQSRSLLGKE